MCNLLDIVHKQTNKATKRLLLGQIGMQERGENVDLRSFPYSQAFVRTAMLVVERGGADVLYNVCTFALRQLAFI